MRENNIPLSLSPWPIALVLVALKVAGVINWPWLWVLSPLWAPFALTMVAGSIILTVAGIIFARRTIRGAIEKGRG